MLSNAIVDFINGASAGFGLIKGSNLFAEQARGDQHVRVAVTTTTGNDYIPELRESSIHILVTGWSIKGGFVLASKIADKLLTMEGSTFTYNNGSQVETYTIDAVAVRTWPESFTTSDKVVFTTNIEFHYKHTVA